MFNNQPFVIWQTVIIFFNTTSTVLTKLTVLSSTTDKINHISDHFWDRWRHEYVVILPEIQQTLKANINFPKINVNDIVLVYDETVPRNCHSNRGII